MILLLIIAAICVCMIMEELASGPLGQDDDNPYADWEDEEDAD